MNVHAEHGQRPVTLALSQSRTWLQAYQLIRDRGVGAGGGGDPTYP